MPNRFRAALLNALLLLCVVCVHAQTTPAGNHRARIESATYPIGFPGSDQPQLTLAQWMDLMHVPAISVAVIDDYKIAWTAQYGIADREHSQKLTAHTLFQAGSISKSVNAFGVLRLVEQGRLTLDDDVNRRLKAWKVPENEFTREQKVTLRRLLSHTAGLTIHGFPGYAVNEPRPTIVQVLDGEKPANTKPVRVDIVPGTTQRYSGGGVTVSQLLLTETVGEPYDRWMQKNVLDAIGMSDSSYQNPPAAARVALTATGYRGTGDAVEGRWHVYPEMAAAGLWTTPTDLAKFGIEVMRALKGESKLITQKTAEEMLTEQKDSAALGFFVKPKTGEFGHNGADEGFQALLVCFRNGKGAALMMNSDLGINVAQRLLWNIAREYGWDYTIPKSNFGSAVLTATLHDGAPVAIAAARKALQQPNVGLEHGPNFALNAAWGLVNAHRWDEALALLDYQLEMTPTNADAYGARGYVYQQTGKRDDALKAVKRALELNPTDENAKSLLKELESSGQ